MTERDEKSDRPGETTAISFVNGDTFISYDTLRVSST